MAKRILSVSLAIMVLALALPLFPTAFAAADLSEYALTDSQLPATVVDREIANFDGETDQVGQTNYNGSGYYPTYQAFTYSGAATTKNESIVDGAYKVEFTAFDAAAYPTTHIFIDPAQGKNPTTDTTALRFHIDTTGMVSETVGAEISIRFTLSTSNGTSGVSDKMFVIDGKTWYFIPDATEENPNPEMITMTTRSATSVWNCYLDVPTGVTGTVILPMDAFFFDENSRLTNYTYDRDYFYNTYVVDNNTSWRHQSSISLNLRDAGISAGDWFAVDSFEWLKNAPVSYKYQTVTQDFTDFVANPNWTWIYGNCSGYGNNPNDSLPFSGLSVNEGRFTVTPAASATDGSRIHITIDEMGDWETYFEAFSFDLDMSAQKGANNVCIRPKLTGRKNIEGTLYTTSYYPTTIYLYNEVDGTFRNLTGSKDTQHTIPEGFKGKVIFPVETWVAYGPSTETGEAYGINDDFTELALNVEITNWRSAYTGTSYYIDNFTYYTNEEPVVEPVPNPNVPVVSVVDETILGANDGKITGVDATMEYRAEADAEYTAIEGTEVTGLAPGKYFVRFAATETYLASADVEVVIAAGDPIPNPNVPNVSAVDETIFGANDGKITGVDATMEYRAEADAEYTAIEGTEITGLAPGKYFVRFAATETYLASADVEVVIAVGAPAPNFNTPDVSAVDETIFGANDGKITGVDATMEYRAEGDVDYIAIEGTEITGLAPGKYYVRYAATEAYLASADVEVVIAVGVVPVTYNVTFKDAFDNEIATIVVGEEEFVAEGDIPAAPARLGYTFIGWSVDLNMPVFEDMTVVALYEKDTTVDYEITANPESEVEVEITIPEGQAKPYYNDRISLSAPLTNDAGQKFAYWSINGSKFSTAASISFLVFDELDIKPVYTDEVEDTVVIYTNAATNYVMDGNKWNMQVMGVVDAGEKEVTEIGILLSASAMSADELKAGYEANNGTVYKMVSTATNGRQFLYTVKGIAKNRTRCATVYAIIDGQMVVGDAVTCVTVE